MASGVKNWVAACVVMLTAPVYADATLRLSEISAYLNGLTTAQSRFTQVHDDGSALSGTLFIKRPGRMRFEYDPPQDLLVIAGGGQVAIFDGQASANPTQYPLSRTPLNAFLARDVDLSGRADVVDVRSDGEATVVTLQDAQAAEYGKLSLVFASNPTQLVAWSVVDAAGGQTQVLLEALNRGADPGDAMFNIPQVAEQWNE